MFNLPRTTLTFRRELRLRSQGARIRGKPKIINFFKALLLYSFVVLLLAVPAFAAVGSVSQQEFEGAISGGFNKESFDFQTFSDVINSANTAILGCTSEACPEELKGGAVNTMGGLIAALYANPPVSGVQYLADISSRFGIVKPAYAQERTGFQALAPILPIWRAFRNLAYLAFVIIFVVMGFAIMFRVKISPQAVITIQSALPRIVIALILVTFSYAIAGLVVDLIYVTLFLIIALLHSQGLIGVDIGTLQQLYVRGNPFTLAPTITTLWHLFLGGGSLISQIFRSNVIFQLLNVVTLGLIPIGISGIITLIFAALVLFALFRLFLTLLFSFIQIILGVIFGPIQILLGALPTPTVLGFGGWLRNLFANAMAFPTAAAIFLLAAILVGPQEIPFVPEGQIEIGPIDTNPLDLPAGTGYSSGRGWVPPFLGVGTVSAAQALIGLGLLLYSYRIVDMVKEALKTPTFETEIGRATGAAAIPVRLGMVGGLEYLRTRYAPGREPLARVLETAIRIAQGGRR